MQALAIYRALIGPTSATLRVGEANLPVQLHRGREVKLPASHPQVQAWLERRAIEKVADPPAPKPSKKTSRKPKAEEGVNE